MDRRYVSQGIVFAWDVDKAEANLRNHGVSFEEAVEAFFDPFLKVLDASRNHETRDAIVGMDSRWRLLFVVHIETRREEFRIISARRATPQERRYYED